MQPRLKPVNYPCEGVHFINCKFTKINPLMIGVHWQVMYLYILKQLFQYVWPFSGHRALNAEHIHRHVKLFIGYLSVVAFRAIKNSADDITNKFYRLRWSYQSATLTILNPLTFCCIYSDLRSIVITRSLSRSL